MRAVAKYAQNARVNASLFSHFAGGAQADLVPLRSGALTALRANFDQNLLPGAGALQRSARAAGGALNTYANKVDSIHRRADGLRANVVALLYGIERAMGETEEICQAILAPFGYTWNTPPPMEMPEPRMRPGVAPTDADELADKVKRLRQVHERRWYDSALRWQREVDEVATARRRWAELIEERRGAEDALSSALADTPLGQLITVGAGTPGGRKRAIAVGLTGELGGVPRVVDALNTGHPLLAGLFPGSDGSRVWDSPPDPEDVVAWWAALSQPEQEVLIRTVPYVIGNLPGLPAWARDRANKLSLEFYRANPQLLGPEQLKLVAEVQRILDDEAEQHVPNPPIQLISFSLRETVPMVAVGYGEIDSASHLSWMAFGMDNDAQNGIKTADTVSRNLLQEQQLMSVRDATSSPATIGWLGYDTPDKSLSGEVLNSESASEGSKRLGSELDGIAALRGVSDIGMPITNVVAHSYGATMAAIALTLIKVPVDSFVMLGGAGLDLDLVPSLRVLNVKNVTNAQKGVFATTAQSDRVAPTGAAWAGRGLVDANAKSILGWERKVPVLGGAVSFPSDGDPSLGQLGTTGHPLIGSQSRPPLGVRDVGYGDIGSQSLFITAQITMQEIGPETLKKLAVTAGEDVRVLVDSESGRKTFLRVPLREAAQR
ncbi:hypothetical protein AUL38_04190 [Leucobacter sp. G161]|nr:hypothetical protein AUL38_04190 [Leucobacter sp. G161]